MECRGFESHPRQLIFHLGKSDCLGCAVLLCLVCLFDLACFFLSSFSSLIKNMYMYMYLSNAVVSANRHVMFHALVALKLLVSLISLLVACSARIVVDKQRDR